MPVYKVSGRSEGGGALGVCFSRRAGQIQRKVWYFMTISRVELQGQVTRAQDFTTIKHNEDNKVTVNQTNIQREFGQTVDLKLRQVNQGEKAENQQKKFDAKEKGNGSYFGDGGRKRKKEEKQAEGKTVYKMGGFDMKI